MNVSMKRAQAGNVRRRMSQTSLYFFFPSDLSTCHDNVQVKGCASPGRKCFFLDTRLKKCSPNLIRKVIFILIFVFFFSIKSISCRKKMVERGGWFTRGDDKEEVHDGSFCELLPSTYLDSSYIWIIIFLSFILDENFLERKRSDRQKMSWKQWRNGLDAEKRSSTRIFW